MPIDVHAHYVPPQLIDAVAARGKDIGVRLVRSDGAPSRDQIREHLSGNYCRCTGYHNIVKAIAAAWPLMHGKAAAAE